MPKHRTSITGRLKSGRAPAIDPTIIELRSTVDATLLAVAREDPHPQAVDPTPCTRLKLALRELFIDEPGRALALYINRLARLDAVQPAEPTDGLTTQEIKTTIAAIKQALKVKRGRAESAASGASDDAAGTRDAGASLN